MLKYGPVGPRAAHLCVDMQEMFARETEWQVPWMPRILPEVVSIAERHPAETIFTRFIPAAEPGEGVGTWARYYRKWAAMTLAEAGGEVVDLATPLRMFVPPAVVFDKAVYSPWMNGRLAGHLTDRGIQTLVITGGETDVCVLATVLGAIDHGFRVVIATDAICSSADATHDALMTLYADRFAEQLETAEVDEILDAWAAA